MNRVKPKRIFGGVKKREVSPLLRSIRERAERDAATVIAQPMAHESVSRAEAEQALTDPVRVKVSDPVAVPLEEVESKRVRSTYLDKMDRRDSERLKEFHKAIDSRKIEAPFVMPSSDALESAAWYLAGVVCHFNRHCDPPPPWPYEFPCKLCFSWAIDSLHTLATHRIPTQELAHGSQKGVQKPVKKGRTGRSGSPSGKPVCGERHEHHGAGRTGQR